MDSSDKNWRPLSQAFYCLAHNDFGPFNTLSDDIKNTEVGKICQEYIRTRNSELIDKAGKLLAGDCWYVALGR